MYEIFEELLKRHDVSAYRVSKETGVTTATLTSWKQGKYIPKNDKLQKIADYFNVSLEYLMGNESDDEKSDQVHYYLNDETRKIAQEIYENKNLRILFDASRKAKPDDLKLIIDMVNRFKGDNM